jgi:DNA-binding CsgD family transcriptional regulator
MRRTVRYENLIGETYDLLTVKSIEHVKAARYYFRCRCRCGNECVKSASALLYPKRELSCGCLQMSSEGEAVRRTSGPNPLVPSLTPRQLEVARLLSFGFSLKDVAAQLGISVNTVWHHIDHIYSRTGIRDRVGLLVILLRNGEINLDDPALLERFS